MPMVVPGGGQFSLRHRHYRLLVLIQFATFSDEGSSWASFRTYTARTQLISRMLQPWSCLQGGW